MDLLKLLIFVFWIFECAYSEGIEDDVISGTCGPGTVNQYSLLPNSASQRKNRREIHQITKATCIQLCNMNRNENGDNLACSAFGYDEIGRVCFLYGNEEITRGPESDVDNSTIVAYEKLCLSAPLTCTTTPAFQKSPGKILLGFTQIVLETVSSKELCLSKCLQSSEEYGFQCMSVMYYTESGDCLLNFESQLSPGVDQFFTNMTEDYTVDYYDNLCAIRNRDKGIPLNACPDKSTPTYISYNQSELFSAAPSQAIYTNISLLECIDRCNQLTNFTCNTIIYSSSNSTCSLSFIKFEFPAQPNVDAQNTTEPSYHRICLEGASLLCENNNPISFQVIPYTKLSPDFVMMAFSTISLEECLSLCLLDPSNHCRSINYDRKRSSCQLNNATKLKAPIERISDDQIDYYENLCLPENKTVVLDTVKDTHRFLKQGPLLKSASVWKKNQSEESAVNLDMEAICEYSDMRVKVTSDLPFTGFIFAKNKFGTCRADINNQTEVILSLQFPNSQRFESPCGVHEDGGNKYSVVVVAQLNNMGIPGLVTEDDRFFNITCDFSSDGPNLVTATGPSMSVEAKRDAPALFPNGMIEIPSPLSIQLSRGNETELTMRDAVQKVILGEKLNLDFKVYPGFNRTGMGLFVRQCNASRHAGTPPFPAALILIDDGCPTASAEGSIVQDTIIETDDGFSLPFIAFKFDGSNDVKISCLVDLCEKGCNPTQCIVDGERVASYGKRKKRSVNIDENNVKKITESGSVIYTVVDKLPITDSRNIFYNIPIQQSDTPAAYIVQFINSDAIGISKRGLCMKRPIFLGVAACFSVVCFCQVVVIAAYVAHQFVKQSGRKWE